MGMLWGSFRFRRAIPVFMAGICLLAAACGNNASENSNEAGAEITAGTDNAPVVVVDHTVPAPAPIKDTNAVVVVTTTVTTSPENADNAATAATTVPPPEVAVIPENTAVDAETSEELPEWATRPFPARPDQENDSSIQTTTEANEPIELDWNPSDKNQNDIARVASELQGVPYLYGGKTTKGFDNPNFLCYVYEQSGVTISRNCAKLASMGEEVPFRKDTLQPGDLLLFSAELESDSAAENETVQTVKTPAYGAVCLSNTTMAFVDGEEGVRVVDIFTPYWQQHIVTVRRLPVNE